MARQITLTPAEWQAHQKRSPLESALSAQIDAAGLPTPICGAKHSEQYHWTSTHTATPHTPGVYLTRNVDFCWPAYKLVCEVQGKVWQRGRHTRGYGYIEDRRVSNWAQVEGWTWLEVTPDMIDSGEAIRLIRTALERGE